MCLVNLIDQQSHRDGEYKFIMVYQDHLRQFVQLRPLKIKTAEEVAYPLLQIFLTFGAPAILHSDSDREFSNQVIFELCAMYTHVHKLRVQYNTPSPTHPSTGTSGTYTFTAEFRPADSVSLSSIEREFSSCSSNLKTISGSFYPCKHASVTVPVETAQTGAPVMFKPKPRTIPTGRAACFPAGISIESPPIPSPTLLDSESVGMNEDSNSSGKMNLSLVRAGTSNSSTTNFVHAIN
ncbi:KRAB-A domain-containing protein 2 [Trichonephila clavata]|uniref:KRAB-A domain-containing protein 2 n=1 Tax=Trichonephila clavata TaxID=2740835 RepID=A0A8X6K697_TRICU|nr:KRAB-A domain-containing protein 2 [Trichonephila clavata]